MDGLTNEGRMTPPKKRKPKLVRVGYVLRDENRRVKPLVFETKAAAKEAMWAGDVVYAICEVKQ